MLYYFDQSNIRFIKNKEIPCTKDYFMRIKNRWVEKDFLFVNVNATSLVSASVAIGLV